MLVAGALAVLGGTAFTAVGISYKFGESRNVRPVQIMLILASIGTVIYGLRATGVDWRAMPLRVAFYGLAVGATQYLALRLIQVLLRLGPMSAMWCAVSLSFLLVVVFEYVAYYEAPSVMQTAGIACAVGCVVLAAMSHRPKPSAGDLSGPTASELPARHSPDSLSHSPASVPPGVTAKAARAQTTPAAAFELAAPVAVLPTPSGEVPAARFGPRLLYVLLLALLLACNSVSSITQLDLSRRMVTAGTSLLDQYSSVLYLGMYSVLAVCVLVQLMMGGRSLVVTAGKWMPILGMVAAVGSVVGIYVTGRAAQLASASGSGAIVYAIVGAVGILIAAVADTVLFKEKRSAAWYGTMVLGVAAVVLGNCRS